MSMGLPQDGGEMGGKLVGHLFVPIYERDTSLPSPSSHHPIGNNGIPVGNNGLQRDDVLLLVTEEYLQNRDYQRYKRSRLISRSTQRRGNRFTHRFRFGLG
jgi:hypothetical protein